MKLKVCDSIMGSGKTQAAINQMNNDKEYKYIFITPYLSEVERIKQACADRNFTEPKNIGEGKLDNLHLLLGKKENIASTHALFKAYTDYTMELIKNGNYKLILDEVFNVVESIEIKKDDLQILLDSDRISVDNENYKVTWKNPEYGGDKFWQMKQMADTGNLLLYKNKFMYWVFPIEVFKSFQDATILTYLFDSQVQKYYYDMHGVEFDYIYTKKIGDMQYEFSDTYFECDYKAKLKEKIHILDDDKLNLIGDSETALCSSWFKREKGKRNKPLIKTLKNNIVNVFNNRFKTSVDCKLWTTFKDYKSMLSGKGYTKAFISCNKRATNEYSATTHLAYCLNVYFVPHLKQYFLDHGVMVKEEEYALSEMLQWIWRSAIRNNNDIWIYIPSKRMRTLLTCWLICKDNLIEAA